MFEVGKRYNFRMIQDGDEVTFGGTVAFYEHPLIKLADLNVSPDWLPPAGPGEVRSEQVIPGQIINVTSVNFISADELSR